MDAWTGLILWGAATGDKKTRDAGIFLYVTEKDAIDHYWFNAYGLYPKEVTVVMDSMIWGSSAQHATWFSGDPICIFGIEYLPMQSGSFYLGTNPDYVKKSVQSLNDERIAWDKTQWEKAKDPKPAAPPVRIGKNMGAWGDLIFMYQALADPAAVLAECDFDKQPMEGGNSRANLYQWVHFLNTVGQVDVSVSADTPLYSVFKQGDTRTYMVYNPKAEKLTVKFSDGKTITTDKAGIAVATGQAK
jgi:endoglucanase Acf2